MIEKIFKNKTYVILLALVVSALWGTLYPMIKVGYQTSEVNTSHVPSIILFAGLRFFISGILLVGILAIKNKSLTLPKKNAILLFLLILILIILPPQRGLKKMEKIKFGVV